MRLRFRQILLGAASLGAGALLAAPLAAQVGTVQQRQLESGFLGDQNSRLVGQHLAGEAYTDRAIAALEQGDYKRSLAILRPYRMTASMTDLLVSGMAYAGLAEYAAARKDYEGALHKRRTYIAAQIALAELEAGHGEKAVALKLLEDITARRDACKGTCADAAELGSGIDRINAALQSAPPAP